MFHAYLSRAGLPFEKLKKSKVNTLVDSAKLKQIGKLSEADLESLYYYSVPKLSDDGVCSIQNEVAPEPYSLTPLSGTFYNPRLLLENGYTQYLWRLRSIVEELARLTEVDWLGVYRKVPSPDGLNKLVKESYVGIISRAEFPLTTEFAKTSNNATVGLTGKAVCFQDLTTYDGPYYECDAKVQSECCLPILSDEGDVLGVIDAESTHKNHFTPERILQLAKVAYDLRYLM